MSLQGTAPPTAQQPPVCLMLCLLVVWADVRAALMGIGINASLGVHWD